MSESTKTIEALLSLYGAIGHGGKLEFTNGVIWRPQYDGYGEVFQEPLAETSEPFGKLICALVNALPELVASTGAERAVINAAEALMEVSFPENTVMTTDKAGYVAALRLSLDQLKQLNPGDNPASAEAI